MSEWMPSKSSPEPLRGEIRVFDLSPEPFREHPGSSGKLPEPFRRHPGSSGKSPEPFRRHPGSSEKLPEPFRQHPESLRESLRPFRRVPGSSERPPQPFRELQGAFGLPEPAAPGEARNSSGARTSPTPRLAQVLRDSRFQHDHQMFELVELVELTLPGLMVVTEPLWRTLRTEPWTRLVA